MRVVFPDDWNDTFEAASEGCRPPQARRRPSTYCFRPDDLLASALKDADIAVALRERTPDDKALLEAMSKLKLIVFVGGNWDLSYRQVDVAMARGVTVRFTSGRGAEPRGSAYSGSDPVDDRDDHRHLRALSMRQFDEQEDLRHGRGRMVEGAQGPRAVRQDARHRRPGSTRLAGRAKWRSCSACARSPRAWRPPRARRRLAGAEFLSLEGPLLRKLNSSR